MNGEVIAILRRAVLGRRDPEDLIEELQRFRSRVRVASGASPPEDVIRADRERRHGVRSILDDGDGSGSGDSD